MDNATLVQRVAAMFATDAEQNIRATCLLLGGTVSDSDAAVDLAAKLLADWRKRTAAEFAEAMREAEGA